MSVIVTLRSSTFAVGEQQPKVVRHPKAQATLVDTRGQLLVLDSRSIFLRTELDANGRALYGTAESELIKHVVASYADGEWSHAKVGA